MTRWTKLFCAWLVASGAATAGVHGAWVGTGTITVAMDPEEHVLVAVDWTHGVDEPGTHRVLQSLEAEFRNDTFTIITAHGLQDGPRRDTQVRLGRAYGPRRIERLAGAAQGIVADQRILVTDAPPEERMRMQGWTIRAPGEESR